MGGGTSLDLVLLDLLGLAVYDLDLPLWCHTVFLNWDLVQFAQEFLGMGRNTLGKACGGTLYLYR